MERGRFRHFLSTHRSDPGKREKVGAKAPRPPWGFLLTNAPKRKVTGPLVVSRVAVFISIVYHGSACGYQRGLFQIHLAFQYLVGYPWQFCAFQLSGVPPHFVFSLTSYHLEALILFIFVCGRVFCYEASPQVVFTCQVGAAGPSCFISFEFAKGYALALQYVERRARCLLSLG